MCVCMERESVERVEGMPLDVCPGHRWTEQRFLPRINMTYIFTLYNTLDVSKLYNYIPTFWTVKNVLLLSSLLDNQCSIVGICI